METERKGDWMLTYTGIHFYPLDARVEEIKIEDIAHALSNICRYGGHGNNFFSVAQHSILASQFSSDPAEALALLLHDAHEAYFGDNIRPIKYSVPWPQVLTEAEIKVADLIYQEHRLGKFKDYEEITEAVDKALLIAEGRFLFNADPTNEWHHCRGHRGPEITIDRADRSGESEVPFLQRYKALTDQLKKNVEN